MVKNFLLAFMIGLLTVGVVIGQDEDEDRTQIAQWASEVEASSQYTDDEWSAEQALGEPDVLACEDNGKAWASLQSTSEETLTLYYKKPVTPTQINIFQTLAPGSITGVDIVPAEGDFTVPVRNSADPGTACPGVFSINLPDGLPETIGVVIYFDQSIGGTWNEIDAVELVGWVEGDTAKSAPSSLESGEFDMYAVTSNDDAPTSSPTSNNNTTSNADYGGEWGTEFSCANGVSIQNGIDITIIQQRSGSNYRATAVGIDGFDPVIAVRDEANNHLCNDDDATGATYSANLPTTGQVNSASSSSQVLFSNTSSGLADITITVGGFDGTGGEFLLIVEGMVSSSADGAGDPFSVYVFPALLESGVTPTAYNIAVTSAFNPVIVLLDGDYTYFQDNEGNDIYCDDAGSASLCWGESASLVGRYVSRSQNRQLPGGSLDAMLSFPIDTWGGYINYTMTGNQSAGDYLAVFHLGTAQEP